MNTREYPHSWRFNSVTCIFLVTALAFLSSTANGQVVADFSGGNSSEVVDGYVGMAGNGWSGPWVEHRNQTSNNPLDITAGVQSTNPLVAGSGNYLHVDIDGPAGAGASREANVSRAYGSFGDFDTTRPHTVSFLLRYDHLSGSWNENANSLFIMDGAGNIPTSTTTWAVSAFGSGLTSLQWTFSSGAGFSNGVPQTSEEHPRVLSDVFLVVGSVYSFELEVNPGQQQYRVWVENLDFDFIDDPGSASFMSDWLPFTADVSEVAGKIVLGLRRSSDGTSTMLSFDQLQIIPEPRVYGIAAGVLVLFLVMTRRRCRGR